MNMIFHLIVYLNVPIKDIHLPYNKFHTYIKSNMNANRLFIKPFSCRMRNAKSEKRNAAIDTFLKGLFAYLIS